MSKLQGPKWRMRSLALILLMGLVTACSGASPSVAPAAEQAQPAASTPPDAGAPAGQPATFEELHKDLIAAAQKEGSLMVYTIANAPAVEKYVQWFGEEFNIRGEFYGAAQAQVHERLASELRANRPSADIVITDNLGVNQLIKDEFVEQYTPVEASNLPAHLTRPGYAYPVNLVIAHVAASTERTTPELREKLRTWEGLLDPSLKDRIVTIDPERSPIAFLTYYMLLDQFGEEFLAKLAAQNPVFAPSPVAAYRAVEMGEQDVVLTTQTNILRGYANGVDAQFFYSSPVAGYPLGSSIVRDLKNPNAAKLFQEWIVTVAGQQSLVDIYGSIALIEDVIDGRPYTKESWFKPIGDTWVVKDPDEFTAKREETVARLKTIFNR